ncbi:ATP-binding protein [Alkaliphilus serpentinus]|nr:ATP-binding protein [Alkaliphilus serpentinus]
MNSTIKKIILICFVTTFMGQIYLNPFNSEFRFSLSVVAFSLFLYFYKDLNIITVSFITGIFVFAFRMLMQFLQAPELQILELVHIHYPAIGYYIFFGIFLRISNFRGLHDKKYMFIVMVTLSDGFANIIELLIRMDNIEKFTGFSVIFFVAFLRSFITILVIEVINYYEMLLMKEQHEERYKQLILLTSNLKSEMFFIKKSMDDIENAMEKSYQLYYNLKDCNKDQDDQLSFAALSLSKDIHEIKKDYLRLTAGLEKILPEIETHDNMQIKDIFNILKSSYEKNPTVIDKNIQMDFNYTEDFMIKHAYQMISIINNLLINSIEAIDDHGRILVNCRKIHEDFQLKVIDNGIGIKSEDMNIIFEPGFTTKFDEDTGKMNSGIGLTHVAHLVHNYFKGSIHVDTVQAMDEGTTVFIIKIPLMNI